EGARTVPPEAVDCDAARRRAGGRGTDAGLLSLDVCVDVDTRPVRGQAKPRLLLPDRCGPELAAGAAGRAPAVFQFPDALAYLHSRGLSRAFSAVPASAAGRLQGAQIDLLCAGLVRRRVG